MKDFKHTLDGDIDLSGNDFLKTEPTKQHQRDIILTRAGALKYAPLKGVGIEDFFNDDNPEEMMRKVRQEFIKDGQKVRKISFENGNLEILANYEEH